VSLNTGAAPLVGEYIARQRLAKIGYRHSLDELSAFKAEAFVLISSIIDEEQDKAMKKKGK